MKIFQIYSLLSILSIFLYYSIRSYRHMGISHSKRKYNKKIDIDISLDNIKKEKLQIEGSTLFQKVNYTSFIPLFSKCSGIQFIKFIDGWFAGLSHSKELSYKLYSSNEFLKSNIKINEFVTLLKLMKLIGTQNQNKFTVHLFCIEKHKILSCSEMQTLINGIQISNHKNSKAKNIIDDVLILHTKENDQVLLIKN